MTRFFVDYYIIGCIFTAMMLVADRPKASWRYICVPILAAIWPWFAWKAINGYRGIG